MNVLEILKGRSVGSLQKKSANAFAVFLKTAENISKVNARISEAEAVRKEKIAALDKELVELSLQRTHNEKLVEKINSFLS